MQTLSSPSFSLPPDSVQQMRDALRRGAAMHVAHDLDVGDGAAWQHVETPKPDAAAWEDTELDIRRVVL